MDDTIRAVLGRQRGTVHPATGTINAFAHLRAPDGSERDVTVVHEVVRRVQYFHIDGITVESPPYSVMYSAARNRRRTLPIRVRSPLELIGQSARIFLPSSSSALGRLRRGVRQDGELIPRCRHPRIAIPSHRHVVDDCIVATFAPRSPGYSWGMAWPDGGQP